MRDLARFFVSHATPEPPVVKYQVDTRFLVSALWVRSLEQTFKFQRA